MKLPWWHLACALVLLVVGACNPMNESQTDTSVEPVVTLPDVTIGLLEGDSAYLFGDIRSVAGDTAGRIYVSDLIGATVRVYDGSGQYVKRIAREGGGPGEIYGWAADDHNGRQTLCSRWLTHHGLCTD